MKAIQIQWMPRIASAVFCLFATTGCGPSEKQLAARAEATRIDCLDKICTGDVAPPRNELTDDLIKLNGQWYVGPKEYFSSVRSGGFYWPSKHPMFKGGNYPERGQGVADAVIEIFLRSNNIPSEPLGYKLIKIAEENGWVAERKTLRLGLDAIKMKHVIGPNGYYIDHVTYYIATKLVGVDGLPPVATCAHVLPNDTGGTGFMWQPRVWVGTRMNQRHCADWPEIFQETTRVLQLLKKA
jgi:hypothetical protein